MLQKRHKLEVYATKEAQTGSLCYKRHKLEVYATKEAQTGSLCYKRGIGG